MRGSHGAAGSIGRGHSRLWPPASADALKNGKFISFETGNESASNSRTYDIVTILGTTELNDFSGQYNTTGRSLGNNRGGTTTITFQFDNAVSAFGFNLGATDSNWSLSANGETYTFLPVSSGNGMNFYGIASKGITAATLSFAGGDWVLIDNLTYVAAVPESATWALMLVGFGLTGAAMRRRTAPRPVQALA